MTKYTGRMLETPVFKKEKIDEYDKKLLFLLRHNSRFSVKYLARNIRLSPERTLFRVNRLLKKGILKGFFAHIWPSIIGLQEHLVLVNTKIINKQDFDEFIKKLIAIPELMQIIYQHSGWNLSLKFRVKNHLELFKVINALKREYIKDYIIMPVIMEESVDWKFLWQNKTIDSKDSISFENYFNKFKKKQEIYKLDKNEIKIINLLMQNARTPIKNISKTINLSPITVKKKIINLIEKRVILSFDCGGFLPKIGYNWYMVYIKLKDNTNDAKINNYIKQFPFVSKYIKTVGPWHYRLNMYAKNNVHFWEILNDLSSNIIEEIESIEWSIVLNEYKEISFI